MLTALLQAQRLRDVSVTTCLGARKIALLVQSGEHDVWWAALRRGHASKVEIRHLLCSALASMSWTQIRAKPQRFAQSIKSKHKMTRV